MAHPDVALAVVARCITMATKKRGGTEQVRRARARTRTGTGMDAKNKHKKNKTSQKQTQTNKTRDTPNTPPKKNTHSAPPLNSPSLSA